MASSDRQPFESVMCRRCNRSSDASQVEQSEEVESFEAGVVAGPYQGFIVKSDISLKKWSWRGSNPLPLQCH